MKSVPFDRRKNGIGNEEAAQRPTSFLWFFGFRERTGTVVASGCGKVGNLLLVFHFSMVAKPGGGNVEISRFLRDFQGTWKEWKTRFWFSMLSTGPAFPRPSISGTSARTVSGIAEATWPWPHSSGERIRCR